LIQGFNLLALLQQPLLLSNSGQLKQVPSSCFSTTFRLPYDVEPCPHGILRIGYAKALIYFALLISGIFSKYNRDILFDFIQDCFFQACAVCEMKEVEMVMESEVI
jgi:hypothetical protein